MRGIGRLVSSECCGEREGHMVGQPLGRVWEVLKRGQFRVLR